MSYLIAGLGAVLIIGLWGLALCYKRSLKAKRASYIGAFQFPSSLTEKVKKQYPHLNDEQLPLVIDGLRDYLLFCLQAKKRMVSMPSQVVDSAWHEFILFTRQYQIFCNKAFGRYLHHTPAEAMHTPQVAQQGIKRAWRLACAKEKINPSQPERLPLIFGLDNQLAIADGFNYALDCKILSAARTGDSYCATHIACAAGCSGDSGHESNGFFDSFTDSGDSSGCSGDSGCGGGGCGGD